MTFRTIKEINKYLQYTVANHNSSIPENTDKKLTLYDIKELKASRDYLDKIFKHHTQTLRNDTYKP